MSLRRPAESVEALPSSSPIAFGCEFVGSRGQCCVRRDACRCRCDLRRDWRRQALAATDMTVNAATPAPRLAVPPSRVTVAGRRAAASTAGGTSRQAAVGVRAAGGDELAATGSAGQGRRQTAADARKKPVVSETFAASCAAVAYRSEPETRVTGLSCRPRGGATPAETAAAATH